MLFEPDELPRLVAMTPVGKKVEPVKAGACGSELTLAGWKKPDPSPGGMAGP